MRRAVPFSILIGASTGGPLSIASILSSFPKDFLGAVIVAQHIAPEYVENLSKWLSLRTKLEVVVASSGEEILPGKVYLSRGRNHLILREDQRLSYIKDERLPYEPSIDRLFQSFAESGKRASLAILLSGMGDDGAKGLKLLKEKGWYTIAEDESSSLVFGMPKAAIALGVVDAVLPASEIPALLFSKLSSTGALL